MSGGMVVLNGPAASSAVIVWDTIGTIAPAPSVESSNLRPRAPAGIPRASRNAISALPAFLPRAPSISPGEKPARSRSTCRSSSETATDAVGAAGCCAAIERCEPIDNVAIAANIDKDLSLRFMVHDFLERRRRPAFDATAFWARASVCKPTQGALSSCGSIPAGNRGHECRVLSRWNARSAQLDPEDRRRRPGPQSLRHARARCDSDLP